jgi:hypothetical protein
MPSDLKLSIKDYELIGVSSGLKSSIIKSKLIFTLIFILMRILNDLKS